MEQELKIERTSDTPAILFNKSNGAFSIAGRSLPEDAFSFYQPIIEWLSEYSKAPASETQLHVNLEYFNTASAKQVFKIVSLMSQAAKSNKVIVNWHYDEGDKDMKASGERFSRLCGLPFEYLKN